MESKTALLNAAPKNRPHACHTIRTDKGLLSDLMPEWWVLFISGEYLRCGTFRILKCKFKNDYHGANFSTFCSTNDLYEEKLCMPFGLKDNQDHFLVRNLTFSWKSLLSFICILLLVQLIFLSWVNPPNWCYFSKVFIEIGNWKVCFVVRKEPGS